MESKVERYVENYVVTKNTMALLPVILSEKKIVTRVVEMNDSFFVFQKPLDIIERSCRKHGSSFLGRKEGTKELTHITHKAPIAISPADQLYFSLPILTLEKSALGCLIFILKVIKN